MRIFDTSFQKWKCEHRFLKIVKFYHINLAHERVQNRWLGTAHDHKLTVAVNLKHWRYTFFGDNFGANMCDFDRRGRYIRLIYNRVGFFYLPRVLHAQRHFEY